MIRRVGSRVCPHRVAHQDYISQLKRFDKPGEKLGEQGVVVVNVRLVGIVKPDEVHDDNPMVFGQWIDDRFPFIQATPKTVQQNDRRAVAGFGVVDVLPVYVDVTGHEFGRLCSGGQGQDSQDKECSPHDESVAQSRLCSPSRQTAQCMGPWEIQQ